MATKALTPGQKLSLRVLAYYATLDESHLNHVFAKTHNTLVRALHQTCKITERHAQLDLVQEIQIKALACFRKQLFQVADPEHPASLYTYLNRVMLSVVIDGKRRAGFKTMGQQLDAEVWDFVVANVPDTTPEPDAFTLAEARRVIDVVTGLVYKLDPKYRDVMLAVRYEGLPYADAAIALNLHMGTVKVRLNKAKQLLLAQLQALGMQYPTADLYAALHRVDNGKLFGTGKGHDRVNFGFHRDKRSFKNQSNTNKRNDTQLLGHTRHKEAYPMPLLRVQ